MSKALLLNRKTAVTFMIIMLCVNPFGIWAQNFDYGNFSYSIDTSSGEATVTGLSKYETINNPVIPDYVPYEGINYPVTTINNLALSRNYLYGTLTIGNNIRTIEDSAFSGCANLTGDLIIPDNVINIGSSVFRNCTGFNGILKLSENLISIGEQAFYECSGFTGDLKIPNTVIYIGASAFSHCSGFSGNLHIGDNVQSIEDSVFLYCSGFKGTLYIGKSVKSIGYGSFMGCTGFTGDLIIPDEVESIGQSAFLVPDGPVAPFTGNLHIGDGVKTIEGQAFQDCSGFKGNLYLGKSLEMITAYAFAGCTGFIGDLIIPNSTVSIGQRAFQNCKGFNGKIDLGNSIRQIGKEVFKNCQNLTGELIIPETIEVIGDGAFYGCEKIESVTFPATQPKLNGNTFNGCTSIQSVMCYAQTPPSAYDNEFSSSVYSTAPLYVPEGVTDKYRAAQMWKLFNNINVIGEPSIIEPESIHLNMTNVSMKVGETLVLMPFITPDDAVTGTLVWTSSNPTIATVNADGEVVAKTSGETEITVFTYNGLSATCDVTVNGPDEEIYIELSDPELTVYDGESVNMWVIATGGNPDGWSFSWSLSESTSVLSQSNSYSFIAINPGSSPMTQVYVVKVRNLSENILLFDESYLFFVTVLPTPQSPSFAFGYSANTSHSKTREGNPLSLFVENNYGVINNDWSYTWKSNGEIIGYGPAIQTEATIFNTGAAGNNKIISSQVYAVVISGNNESGTYSQTEIWTPNVDIYSRPHTPVSLLRKGNGTSCTFIAMSDLDDATLSSLGYNFVYGYTDALGSNHVIASTPNRYCHTTDQIYNDTLNDFWVYSVWTYDDGTIISSGLRYLDGHEDELFDASSFGASPQSADNYSAESVTYVYTIDGHFVGHDTSTLSPGLYIVHTVRGNEHNTVKIAR